MKTIASILAALVFGVIFGLGLVLSHMIDPARVANFLDVTGNWNPSLAFVMAGAIVIAAPAFAIARRRPQALLGPHHPPRPLQDRSEIGRWRRYFRCRLGASVESARARELFSSAALEPHAVVFVSSVVAGNLALRVPARGHACPSANPR